MKRREFLSNLSIGAGGIFLPVRLWAELLGGTDETFRDTVLQERDNLVPVTTRKIALYRKGQLLAQSVDGGVKIHIPALDVSPINGEGYREWIKGLPDWKVYMKNATVSPPPFQLMEGRLDLRVTFADAAFDGECMVKEMAWEGRGFRVEASGTGQLIKIKL